jgi:AraC-like DNA-binding protein
MKHPDTRTWIVQGTFGRASVTLMGRPLVAHAHAQFNILIKVGGADSAFKVGETTERLTDHTVMLFNPWIPHAKLESEGGPSLVLALLLEQTWMSQVLAVPVARLSHFFPEACVAMAPEVRREAERLAAAITQPVAAPEDDTADMLIDLVGTIARLYGDVKLAGDHLAARRPLDYRIRKALDYIRKHAAENPNLDRVAAEVGLSRSRFFEQFKLCVGVPPKHYVDWMRMSLATRLLGMSQHTIAEISDELGFSAQSHFTRFFVQHLGISPSEWRRQALSLEPTEGPSAAASSANAGPGVSSQSR